MLIPATAATVERAHSSLKFVKNDLRSTMSEYRMNALMSLYIHKDLSLNYDQIIDDFAGRNSFTHKKSFKFFFKCKCDVYEGVVYEIFMLM